MGVDVCLFFFFFCSYAHLDIYSGLNTNLNRQHHRLESRYSSSSGGSYEEEKSKYIHRWPLPGCRFSQA